MKLLLFIILGLPSCALRVYDNGKLAIADYSNFDGEETYKSKTLYFHRKGKQDVSTPMTSTGSAASKIIGTLGLGAAAAVVPH